MSDLDQRYLPDLKPENLTEKALANSKVHNRAGAIIDFTFAMLWAGGFAVSMTIGTPVVALIFGLLAVNNVFSGRDSLFTSRGRDKMFNELGALAKSGQADAQIQDWMNKRWEKLRKQERQTTYLGLASAAAVLVLAPFSTSLMVAAALAALPVMAINSNQRGQLLALKVNYQNGRIGDLGDRVADKLVPIFTRKIASIFPRKKAKPAFDCAATPVANDVGVKPVNDVEEKQEVKAPEVK